ncbi:hypothetical protein HPB51_020741 [Rhipicephalus microplus]|uniref:C2H2-type domain-containing protein n=1 Tax=Rhipicephalus microplus TaxID=6941 RepID=A0A9J6EBR6_RHIMP|nr:hypothetical protein HPB51_020741 [Rhipicephalus microplus]
MQPRTDATVCSPSESVSWRLREKKRGNIALQRRFANFGVATSSGESCRSSSDSASSAPCSPESVISDSGGAEGLPDSVASLVSGELSDVVAPPLDSGFNLSRLLLPQHHRQGETAAEARKRDLRLVDEVVAAAAAAAATTSEPRPVASPASPRPQSSTSAASVSLSSASCLSSSSPATATATSSAAACSSISISTSSAAERVSVNGSRVYSCAVSGVVVAERVGVVFQWLLGGDYRRVVCDIVRSDVCCCVPTDVEQVWWCAPAYVISLRHLPRHRLIRDLVPKAADARGDYLETRGSGIARPYRARCVRPQNTQLKGVCVDRTGEKYWTSHKTMYNWYVDEDEAEDEDICRRREAEVESLLRHCIDLVVDRLDPQHCASSTGSSTSSLRGYRRDRLSSPEPHHHHNHHRQPETSSQQAAASPRSRHHQDYQDHHRSISHQQKRLTHDVHSTEAEVVSSCREQRSCQVQEHCQTGHTRHHHQNCQRHHSQDQNQHLTAPSPSQPPCSSECSISSSSSSIVPGDEDSRCLLESQTTVGDNATPANKLSTAKGSILAVTPTVSLTATTSSTTTTTTSKSSTSSLPGAFTSAPSPCSSSSQSSTGTASVAAEDGLFACRWKECEVRLRSEDALGDHVRGAHVDTQTRDQGVYLCRWQGCKVLCCFLVLLLHAVCSFVFDVCFSVQRQQTALSPLVIVVGAGVRAELVFPAVAGASRDPQSLRFSSVSLHCRPAAGSGSAHRRRCRGTSTPTSRGRSTVGVVAVFFSSTV